MRRIEDVINVAQYISGYLKQGKKLSSGEVLMDCPFHEDSHASFSINTQSGLWKCHVPNCKGYEGGNLIQLVAFLENLSTKEAYQKILEDNGIKEEIHPAPKELCEEKIIEYNMALLAEKPALEVLHKKYHYSAETIAKFKLGWNGTRLTIPIYDETGKLVNIRKKPLDSGHCLGIEFFNQMRLFPILNLQESDTVYLFEGEKDCMLACQLGLNAMSVTSGAGSFNQEWVPLFKDKNVVICYDIDDAGLAGAHKVKEFLLNAVNELRIVLLPIIEPPNGDFTDYITQGGDLKSFLKLVEGTKPEEKLITQTTRIPTFVHEVELGEAMQAKYFYKRVSFNVVVSGKDTQPYLPPSEIEITCPCNQSFCKYCGMAMYGGKYTFKLNELSQDILQWIDCTEDHHNLLIKKNLEIPMKCKLWKSFTAVAQTVEEITLIPEISYSSKDTEYVVRSAYVIGKQIKSNCNYRFEAVTMPHPLTQYATHLIYLIQENKTAIDEFKINNLIREQLRVFQIDHPREAN